ncbi:MAG: DHH family phosphoesterase [Caldisphaera sp.]|jgi:hypothetical protein|nr:MAG: hypothetical protein C0171_05155 [Caldisphaera sp.]
MSYNEKNLMRLLTHSNPLVIHHWDADGVISAATLATYIGQELEFESPPFEYKIDENYLEMLSTKAENHDTIVILDLNLPSKYLVSLSAKLGKPVISIDHHTTNDTPKSVSVIYYNPAKNGDPEGLWPSAAHVIASLTGSYDPLLISSSIVGDLDNAAKNNKVFKKYMNEIGLDPIDDFEMPLNCSLQIWGAEAMGKIDIIKTLPSSLAYGGLDPCYALLSDPVLTTLRLEAEEELNSLINKTENKLEKIKENIYFAKIDGKARLISKISREISYKHPNDIIMIGYLAKSTGNASIYIRTRKDDINLFSMLENLKNLGYQVGGKFQLGNNVLAIDVETENLDKAINNIIDYIKNKNF